MAESMQHLLTHKHVLLLQGKMGTFFSRFASFLMAMGIQVSKINFNAGDAFFYKHNAAYDYTGELNNFSSWLADFISQHHIDAVVCFGDCRPHHHQASELCPRLGVSFFVFEEGYLRPDYITLQEHGINGYSKLDTDNIRTLKKATDQPLQTHNSFFRMACAATIYYIITQAFQRRYPHYQHYRGMSAWQEAGAWIKAGWRKMIRYFPDKRLQKYLQTQQHNNYFLVSLQVHNDSQITHHSDYQDVLDFIYEVIVSFANHAPSDMCLVFKHHPLDRGHRDYRANIHQMANKHGLAGRVYYGCDMHLPTLIKHSRGMVTINSTTGLQSIYHQKPTKVMGRAIYDIAPLADPQPLETFWQRPQRPQQSFYLRFRKFLIEQTQLNGSFYGDSPWMVKYLSMVKQTTHIQKIVKKTPLIFLLTL